MHPSAAVLYNNTACLQPTVLRRLRLLFAFMFWFEGRLGWGFNRWLATNHVCCWFGWDVCHMVCVLGTIVVSDYYGSDACSRQCDS